MRAQKLEQKRGPYQSMWAFRQFYVFQSNYYFIVYIK